MSRILFVDDEPKVLEGLRRMLRGMRHQWDMAFCPGGAEALACLDQNPCEVVVTDMRMPGMDGAELLEELLVRHPATARVVLSGQCEREAVLKAVGPAHQFLTKPCESEAVKRTLLRIEGLRSRLPDPWHREIVARLRSLPSPPSLYKQLRAELDADRPDADRVASLLARDVAAAAKLLQLVSSSFFGTPKRVGEVRQAAGLLGLDTLKAVTCCPGVLRPFPDLVDPKAVDWVAAHALRVEAAARRIALSETHDPMEVGQAALAGLLHDIGLWVLADAQPERFAPLPNLVRAKRITFWEAERQGGTATHTDLGGYLLGLWGLPDPIVEAAAWHHTPHQSSEAAGKVLAIVHVANALVEAAEVGLAPEQAAIDHAFLARAGLHDRLGVWCRAAMPLATDEVAAWGATCPAGCRWTLWRADHDRTRALRR